MTQDQLPVRLPPDVGMLIYQTEDGRTRISVRMAGETVWLTQAHMAELFQSTKQNVSLHIQNIFDEKELHEDSVVKDYLITAADGKNYQTKLGIYATSMDYDPKNDLSQQFFATVQNKMHWAAHGHTAAEIIAGRADASKPNMGLTTWPGERPHKADVGVAKNYLAKDELQVDQGRSGHPSFSGSDQIYISTFISKLMDVLNLIIHRGEKS